MPGRWGWAAPGTGAGAPQPLGAPEPWVLCLEAAGGRAWSSGALAWPVWARPRAGTGDQGVAADVEVDPQGRPRC